MHLPTRYVTKITAASVALLAALVFSFSARSQEPSPEKPRPATPSQTPAQPPAPTQTPAPGNETKEAPKQKLGSELDDRSLITNTDLITLTVTVTDTYG